MEPWLQNLFNAQRVEDGRKQAIVLATSELGIASEAQLREQSVNDLYDALLNVREGVSTHTVVFGLNLLFEASGRKERLNTSVFGELSLGRRLSSIEKGWADGHLGALEWYRDFKRAWSNWVQSSPSTGILSLTRRKAMIYTGCHIVRTDKYIPITNWSISDLNDAFINGMMRATHQGSSLWKQKRGHRNGDNFDPVKSMFQNYHVVTKRLAEYLQLPVGEVFTLPTIRRRLAPLLPVEVDACQKPVDDALTGDEMERAMQVCENPLEMVIMCLLCRLGMRIGALANLRLSGIVRDYDKLLPGLKLWGITDTISSYDKNQQLNTWPLERFPKVVRVLEQYINSFWRGKYEEWHFEDTGRQSLAEGWLLPVQRNEVRMQMRTTRPKYSIYHTVKVVLSRAGINKERAHPHAIRKGVVTELLRAGNPLKTVSTFVHHKSTTVTERSYDKRKKEELLEKMVLPIGWEELLDATNEIVNVPATEDATSTTTNSRDRERANMVTTAMGLVEKINGLKRKLDVMESCLSPRGRARYERLLSKADTSCAQTVEE